MNQMLRQSAVAPEAELSAPPPSDRTVSPKPAPAGKERNSYLRYGAALAAIAVVIGGAIYLFVGNNDMPPPRQVRELTIVNIVPPPPPPPPPPQQMPEQKMIEQPKMVEPEIKPEQPDDKPPDDVKDAKNDEPPGPLNFDAKPEGPGDSFGVGGHPGGNPYGGGGGHGSRWGWYVSIVQGQIESALRANRKTRNAVMQVQVRLWADGAGRVNRVQLVSSTGDADLDATIRNEVLGSLTLREPPPRDMPMPMVTRVTARRPS